jgi:hypothetical protein
MNLPTDFLQTVDGDLDLSLGLRNTTDLVTYVKQKLTETFSFFQGEWQGDLRLGIPYFRYVLGQRYDQALLRTIFFQAAARTHGVGSVEAIDLEFDSKNSMLYIRPKVRTVAGEEVPLAQPIIVEIT